MEVKTKFNVDDEVFFMRYDEVDKGTITTIEIYDKGTFTKIVNIIRLEGNEFTGLPDDKIFNTKQELLESL